MAQDQQRARYSTRTISTGFAVVILLMLAMVAGTVERVTHIQAKVGEIGEHHSHHMQLAHRMYHAARERSFVLVRLVHQDDMLAADEYAMRFRALEHEVAEAKRAIDTNGLIPDERVLLDKLSEAIRRTVPLQERAIDLYFDNRREEAMRLLVQQALPAQEEVLVALTEMIALQEQESAQAGVEVAEQLRLAERLLLLTTAIAVLMTVVIAYYVQHHTGRLMSGLSETSEQLRHSLRDLDFQKRALDEHAIVSIADRQGRITYVNDRFCSVSQYSREELLGKDHRIVNSGVHPKELFIDMWRTIAAGKVWHGEVCNRKKDGSLYWVSTTILPGLDETGRPGQYVSIRTEITAIKEAEELLESNQERLEALVEKRTAELAEREAEFQRLAETDMLTGVANRRKFDEMLLVEISRTQRHGLPLTLVMLDIDHFKKLNDTHGHQAGDMVLIEFSRLVAANIRAHDFFARWGGEEFAILATMSNSEDTRQFADKLRRLIADNVFPEVGHVTVSLGLSTYRPDEDEDDLLSRADQALYAAKSNGRNRVEVM